MKNRHVSHLKINLGEVIFLKKWAECINLDGHALHLRESKSPKTKIADPTTPNGFEGHSTVEGHSRMIEGIKI